MPKATFRQIKPEKQEHILRTAARVFAERGFARTDVAEIAARAGVAKGSLYNYFESKEDLYVHICRDGMRRSREAVYGNLDPAWDIYRQVERIFANGFQFLRAHPEYLRLYLNVSSAGMESFAEQLTLEVEKRTADHLKGVLKRDREAGRIRPDIDVNMAAFLINNLYVMLMMSLVSRHFQIRMKEYLEIRGELDATTVEAALILVVRLIHNFLKPNPSE